MTLRMSMTIPVLLSLACACGGGDPKADVAPTPAAEAAPSAAPLAVAIAAPVDDPPPAQAQRTGLVEPEKRPDQNLTITVAEVNAGHLYLLATDATPERPFDPNAAPVAEVTPLLTSDPDRVSCRVRGPRHGVAVPGSGGGGERGLRVRLVGAEPAPSSLEVVCDRAAVLPLSGDDDTQNRGAVQTFRLSGKGATRTPARAPFFLALADWFEARARISWSRQDPTLRFAAARSRRLGENKLTSADPGAGARDRGDLAELMSLYTGLTSAEEALQTDRGLLIRTDGKAGVKRRTFPIASIAGVPLPAHPWAAMIAEKKLVPVVESLAALAPVDTLYLHFGDLRAFVSLLRDVDRWLAPAARALEMSPGDWGIAERYERELAVERTGLAEKLGHLAAKSVAVVIGDPLVREGTDVTLLFEIANETLLNTTLAGFAASARARRPDAVESQVTLGGQTVQVLSTPDGEVRQHKVKIGGVLVVSNSAAAVERILATVAGRHPSLAKSGDFQYFRGLYPAKSDAGFAFISDAFVGRVTGPAFKVAASRRMEARADLRALSAASLLHAFLEGGSAADSKALVAAGTLAENELLHGDGQSIAFDVAQGPSSAWGRPARLRSLIDVEREVTTLTEGEKLAYEQFRESYQTYWRTFIDPIGVELRPAAGGKGWHADARLLPLIDGTDYRELERLTGGGALVVPKPSEGVNWRFAVGPNSELRRDLERDGRHLPGMEALSLSWLGDWAGAGMLDRSAIWDVIMLGREVPNTHHQDRGTADSLPAVARLPLYGEVQLRDRLAFAVFLTGVRAAIDQTTGGIVAWGDDGKHRDIPIVSLRERPQPGGMRMGPEGLALYYAIAADVFVISLNRAALIARIDASLDADRTPAAAKAQVALQYTPRLADGPLNRTIAALTENELRNAHRAAGRASEFLLASFAKLAPAEREARAVALLGFAPRSPFGGVFSLDADGRLQHDRLGSEPRPIVLQSPVTGAPLTEFLSHLAGLDFSLAFEGGAKDRALHVEMGWRTR